MRYVGDIITRVRRHTINEGETSTSGIQDDNFLDYINDAQTRLQSLLVEEHMFLFEEQTTASIVASQRAYVIPADAFLKNRVIQVEYSSTSNAKDYHVIRPVTFRELNPVEINHPRMYSILNGSVYVSPVPTSATGSLRITYTRRLDQLDLRRGTVSTHTDSGTAITALTLSTTGDDVTALDAGDTLCVCDRDGTVTMYNIRYDSYDDTTGVVTLTGGSHTYDTGESITNGDYVTVGAYTTTHSSLNDLTEKYLAKYAVMEILALEDSSMDFAQAAQTLNAMEAEIVNAYAPDGDDVEFIAYVNDYYR